MCSSVDVPKVPLALFYGFVRTDVQTDALCRSAGIFLLGSLFTDMYRNETSGGKGRNVLELVYFV